MSRGVLVSYRLGATKMMPQVPATQAKLKTHKRILSSTMATYFQSSDTFLIDDDDEREFEDI